MKRAALTPEAWRNYALPQHQISTTPTRARLSPAVAAERLQTGAGVAPSPKLIVLGSALQREGTPADAPSRGCRGRADQSAPACRADQLTVGVKGHPTRPSQSGCRRQQRRQLSRESPASLWSPEPRGTHGDDAQVRERSRPASGRGNAGLLPRRRTDRSVASGGRALNADETAEALRQAFADGSTRSATGGTTRSPPMSSSRGRAPDT